MMRCIMKAEALISSQSKAPNSSHADTEIEAPTSSVIQMVKSVTTNDKAVEGSKEEDVVGATAAVMEKEMGNAEATPEEDGATPDDEGATASNADVAVARADMDHMPDLVLRKILIKALPLPKSRY